MATVELRYDPKDSAWFAANATMVLKAGEPAYHSVTGKFKLGDGVTQLQNLEFLSNESQLVTATVVNKTGVNLLASNYQVVKVSTAQGQRLAVDFAQANNDNNSADTIGLVKENIAINQTGDITILGQITEINTTGSLYGETWADGDVLYLSPTTPGAITKVKPTGLTGHIVVLGYVEYAHAIHGKIYVKIMNGFELDELHNVYVNPTTLANNDVLTYESSSQLWKNKQVISQTITNGVTDKAPSEDAIFDALGLKLTAANNLSDLANPLTARNNLKEWDLRITTGNQSTISNVAINITDLVSPTLTANKLYDFEGHIYTGCNNTGGVKFQITIPTGSTIVACFDGSIGTNSTFQSALVTASSTLTGFSFIQFNGTNIIKVKGQVLLGGTAGTIQFGFASATNTQTSTVYQLGTHITLRQLD